MKEKTNQKYSFIKRKVRLLKSRIENINKVDPGSPLGGIETKDVEHLIYDIKNCRNNLVYFDKQISKLNLQFSFISKALNFDENEVVKASANYNSLYDEILDELEAKDSLSQKNTDAKIKNLLSIQSYLENRLLTRDNTNKYLDETTKKISLYKEILEQQKIRYNKLLGCLKNKGVNTRLYEKDFEKATKSCLTNQTFNF